VSRWEQFARSDAQFYVDPTLGDGLSAEEFRAGGRAVVERALAWAGELPEHGRALEIGCGVGRNTVHLAERFARVEGVDVSETMVESARRNGLPANVELHVGSGRDLGIFEDDSFDFAFSHLVFQHIAEDEAIEGYLHDLARVLKPAGVAVLQFDTRPTSRLTEVVQMLPDPLLPRIRRRGMRRVRRSAGQIRQCARTAGLTLEEERERDSSEHWFRWRA
jgi:ubiquinone/menaquinone biosynthesis C-methylase UbiE